MKQRVLLVRDIFFYGIVTVGVVIISVFSAFEGWYIAAVIVSDGSCSRYAARAALYGAGCNAVCSAPLLPFFLWLEFRSETNRRITLIWIAGFISACFSTLIYTLLPCTHLMDLNPFSLSFFLVTAVPPVLLGLSRIIHILRGD